MKENQTVIEAPSIVRDHRAMSRVPEANNAMAPVSNTPAALLAMAVQQGADLQKLEKLMELERQWKADQAKEAYFKAVSEFKKVPLLVTKDKLNKQYNSRYTGQGNLVNTVNPVLAQFGLSASWEIDQTNTIKVTCVLSHALGHSQKVSLSGPPDTSGAKNVLQQIKSTITYLEIATFQAVTGVASSDDAGDDDGNGSDAVVTITEQQAADVRALIEEVAADTKAFLGYLAKTGKVTIGSVEEIPANMHKEAVALLERKRKEKK